jgi:hypothetical protein
MTAPNCLCTSAADHEIFCKAYLCGDLDAVTEPPTSRSTSPVLSSLHSPLSPTSPLPTRKARFDRCQREIREKKWLAFLEKSKKWSAIPDFFHSSWHLSRAKKSSNGYHGCSATIHKGIPEIPKNSDAAMHLKILRKNGYRVIKAPVYAH